MGVLNDVKTLRREIEEAKEKFGALIEKAGESFENYFGDTSIQLTILGESVGKVVGFRILRSDQTGFPKMEMTFTDRGIYTYDNQQFPGGTNATYEGFLDDSLVFYGQGNGMSVALYPDQTDAEKPERQRTYSTWLTEGVAKLEPTLTGAGTYRGSMLYRWQPDGRFASLNGTPAIFQLFINEFGFTFGKIWRWVLPAS
jgi:hypothetical protein